jgi:hypothetical protein
MRPPRCPKCHKFPLRYVETSDAFQVFDANDKGVPDPEGYNSHGSITSLRAECACGHKWKPRGISQVTQVDGYRHPYETGTGGGVKS